MAGPNGGGTYSFKDVQAAIVGPGGAFTIGNDAGVAAEGISVEMADAKGSMVQGADGSWMHSLHAANGGRFIVRLLKTSPVNNRLMNMYNYQRTSSAYWGNNTLSMKNPVSGDSIVAQGAAFERAPTNVNAVEGGVMEWAFMCGTIDQVIGTYAPLGI
jgi:hypothetical protein